MNKIKPIRLICSWPVIIISLYLMWPAGIILLLLRTGIDRKTAVLVRILADILGVFAWLIVLMSVIAGLDQGFVPDEVNAILFYALVGAVFFLTAGSLKRSVKRTDLYRKLILDDLETDLAYIAGQVGRPYSKAVRDVWKLIDRGILKDAYISEGQVKLPMDLEPQEDEPVEEPEEDPVPERPQTEPRIVVCECCGGINSLTTETGVCDYCGSPFVK